MGDWSGSAELPGQLSMEDCVQCPKCGRVGRTPSLGCDNAFHEARELRFPASAGVVARRADAAEYTAEPMPPEVQMGGGKPVVTLLNATPDPLGSLAAICAMYTGRVVRSLSSITDDERSAALDDMMSTELSGPLEAITFHFLIEGVDRSFTHQAVRGRSAFYAQESLRFAVKEGWEEDVPFPPAVSVDDHKSSVFAAGLASAAAAYQKLIDLGTPAEEARGLLPHAVLTRYHWVCSLRELLHVAGLRTCTQAQFHWRIVMGEVARALRELSEQGCYHCDSEDGWQFALIADKLRPVCYQTGRCGFMAKFDRGCTIRDRVEANAAAGRPSSKWGEIAWRATGNIEAIDPAEWAADPGAART